MQDKPTDQLRDKLVKYLANQLRSYSSVHQLKSQIYDQFWRNSGIIFYYQLFDAFVNQQVKTEASKNGSV